MTREELVKFLKENLKLEIRNYWVDAKSHVIDISIFICNKKITSDKFLTQFIV